MNKKNLVIVGTGFAGIYTYRSLPVWVRRTHNIILVDKRNHFLFTPLLAEVAGSNLDDRSVVEPIRDIIHNDARFIQGEVTQVQSEDKKITINDSQELEYDILVMALGSRTHFFDTPGAADHTFALKDLDDAILLRNRAIDIFEQASRIDDTEERKKMLRWIIIGGGPTGVELAGEFSDLFFGTLYNHYRTLSKDDIEIILMNASPEILGVFEERLRRYATAVLGKQKVKVKNNTQIIEVRENKVITADGEVISAHTIIWTAGVAAQHINMLGVEYTKGKIDVDNYLRASADNFFVLGDMSRVATDDGRGYPMTAQVAKQQGVQTGKNIGRMLQGKKMKPFVYKEKGLLASVGAFEAVGQIKGFYFTGSLAWFMWRTIYLFNFISFKKRLKIALEWTINLFSPRDTSR